MNEWMIEYVNACYVTSWSIRHYWIQKAFMMIHFSQILVITEIVLLISGGVYFELAQKPVVSGRFPHPRSEVHLMESCFWIENKMRQLFFINYTNLYLTLLSQCLIHSIVQMKWNFTCKVIYLLATYHKSFIIRKKYITLLRNMGTN